MTSDRWRRIEETYDAVRHLSAEERVRYLGELRPDDAWLRVEVESLLAQERSADEFLETPAVDEAAALLAGEHQPIATGTKVGAYEIESLLGAGGMGEVYRAHDARLGRDVAIKILFPLVFPGQDARARFDREARLLASLSHPNIGAIYGVEDFDAGLALILELVEGPTLASPTGRAERRSVPECLALSAQIAAALEAAHEKGIVHRDLKPANIKVTADGLVKVIDFGLAKFTPAQDSSLAHQGSGTEVGIVVGTAAYMSPEQARGFVTDKRTDVWAFGAVLYELLCGRAAFAGATRSDTLAAVLQQDPDWAALPDDVPPAIRRLLQRCLEKDAKRRLRDIGDARLEITDALSARTSRAISFAGFPPHVWALGLAAMALVGLSGFAWLRPAPAPKVLRFDRTTISDRVDP